MSDSIQKMPEVPILLCVLLDCLFIENQAMRHREEGGLVKGVSDSGQGLSANHAVTFSLGMFDLKVAEFDIVEASP